MRDETLREMPEDLRNVDRFLFALAQKALVDYGPQAVRHERICQKLREMKPEAQVVPLLQGRISAYPSDASGKKVWHCLMAVVAAALMIIACWQARRVAMRPLGSIEFRSGLAGVVRSGRMLGSSTVPDLRSGDLLETHEGRIVALLDKRVRLFMNEDTVVHLTGRSRMNLERGEIWVYVVPGSGIYVIDVPGAAVQVLGTSFGLQAGSGGVSVFVASGIVFFTIRQEDVQIAAGERFFWPAGQPLSSAEKNGARASGFPLSWVESLLKDKSSDELRQYFPSLVPLDSKSP